MCGIGGVWFFGTVDTNIVDRLVLASEKRGLDALGSSIFASDGSWVESFRSAKRASNVVVFDEKWGPHLEKIRQGGMIIFNTRAQPLTEVESVERPGVSLEETVQPVHTKDFAVVHNGVVANTAHVSITNEIRRGDLKTNIDSEYINVLLERFAIPEAMSKLSGGFAVAALNQRTGLLHLIKDFKTLYFAWHSEKRVFAFASEPGFLEEAFEEKHSAFGPLHIEMLPAYTATTFVGATHEGPQILKQEPIQTRFISSLPEQKNLALVCASGGIDSTTAAYIAKYVHKKDVVLVHFRHGQKSGEMEEWAVTAIAQKLDVPLQVIPMIWLNDIGQSRLTAPGLEVPKAELENIKSTVCWTPARNFVMMAALAAMAEGMGADSIYAGWSLEEEGSYPDNSIDFFRTFNDALTYGTIARPQVRLALSRLMKRETIILGHHLGVPYEHTWSCDNGDLNGHCGECGACFLHHYAFVHAGIPDPTKYAGQLNFAYRPPWDTDDYVPSEVPIETILEKIT